MKLTATPVETLEPLAPVSFSANSFLLQANQNATLDTIAKHLLSPGRTGVTVRLDAMKPSGGSSTFNDYLCERRISEVTRLLAERGVDPAILRTDTVDSRSPIDSGEVRITVVIPPLPSPDPALPAPGNGSPAPAPAASPAP
jgi:outer membrane protein OmpA-like peptidoglycan-associated protein